MKTPPLLLAVALLFWGWQADQIAFATFLALTLEGSRILSPRFELSALEFNRFWNLCLLAFIILIVTVYVSNKGLGSIYVVLQWIPLVLSPMVAAQIYSAGGKIPTVGFKIFYRKKDSAENGLPAKTIDILYPYFAICILAACAVGAKNIWFYWGMCLLCAWALGSVRPRRFSWVTWSVSLSLIVLLGFWGGKELFKLRYYVDAQMIDWLSKRFKDDQDSFRARTAIGEIVELKMDDTILFYVGYEKGHLKKTLLPQSSYNFYIDAVWYATQSKFKSLNPSSENQWTFASNLEPEKIIQVSMDLNQGKGLLLVPNQAFRFSNLPVLYLKYNPLGAIHVEESPEFIEYQVSVHPSKSRNAAPNARDLKVPEELQPVLQRIVDNLQLAGKPPDDILKAVDQYFEDNFSYSLNLTREDNTIPPLVDFLTKTRKGHCEYFATAAVLLLRQAGVPARYTVGYSAHEYNWMQENLVVRSRDAHAWTIAYVNGQWRNFDTTPSTWIDRQEEEASSFEVISDIWSQAAFLFSQFRWGKKDENFQQYMMWLLIPPSLYLVWRIASRARRAHQGAQTGKTSFTNLYRVMASDFNLIESKLNQLGFAREEWETYSHWLRRIHQEHPGAPVNGLAKAVALYSRERFDPQGLTGEEEARLKTEIHAWLQTPQ